MGNLPVSHRFVVVQRAALKKKRTFVLITPIRAAAVVYLMISIPAVFFNMLLLPIFYHYTILVLFC